MFTILDWELRKHNFALTPNNNKKSHFYISIPETKEETNSKKFNQVNFNIVVGIRRNPKEENWKEMSYKQYEQEILDFSFSEYSDGDWHKDKDWKWD